MSKRMTLVSGAVCVGGMVFCSDTEEGTAGGGKRSVRKLFEYSDDKWDMVIGTAGFGPLCDVAIKRIELAVKAQDFVQRHYEILGEVMAQVYKQYVPQTLPDWKQAARDISLVVGINDRHGGQACLYQTNEEIVQPSQHRFVCAGVGQEIAYYLLDRLFDASLEYSEGKDLLAFVMREAKESVGNVGGNTEMVVMLDDSKGTIRSGFAAGWEAKQPNLSHCIKKFWLKK